MAIQAQMYSDNLGFPLGGGGSGGGDGGYHDFIDNGGGGLNSFSFTLQEQQRHQMQQQLQQRNQKLFLQNNYNNQSNQPMVFSQSVVAQLEKQKQEIDAFISLQNERLRLGLLQQRNQQMQSILKKCETKAQIMLRQKDEEIAKALNRTIELEDFLRRIEMDSQSWQRVANENELMVVNLNNTIEQMKQQYQQVINGVEDAESCCETGQNRGLYEDEAENVQASGKIVCKNCTSGNSSVILLPCRHLSACKDCQVFLDHCPVCKMAKKSSIEVLF